MLKHLIPLKFDLIRDLADVVNTLKQQPGKNLIVYGGANFVGELISQSLIDDLYLFVHPISIGQGLRVFNGRSKYQLVKSTVCDNGVIINHYTLSKEA